MSITTGTNNILTCFVQQRQSSTLQMGVEDAIYDETWKGPKSQVERIGDGGLTLYGVTFQIGKPRPTLNSNFNSYYNPPEFKNNEYVWVLDDIQSDDSDSGDLVILKMRYKAKAVQGGGWDIQDGTIKEVKWRVSWGDRGVTALAYLDPTKYGARQISYICDPALVDESVFELQGTIPTIPAIKGYANRSSQTEKYTNKPYEYVKGVTICKVAIDNPDIKKVADYYDSGISPQLHFPIVTRTTTSRRAVNSIDSTVQTTRPYEDGDQNGTKTYYDKKSNTKKTVNTQVSQDGNTTTITTTVESVIGADIDRISSPEGIPFKFNENYQWLKVSDDITQTDDGYERNEIWWGDFKWNEDFYGENRLKLGTVGN